MKSKRCEVKNSKKCAKRARAAHEFTRRRAVRRVGAQGALLARRNETSGWRDGAAHKRGGVDEDK